VSNPRAPETNGSTGPGRESAVSAPPVIEEPARTLRPAEVATPTPRRSQSTIAITEADAPAEVATVRCTVCLEIVPAAGKVCPECNEPFGAADAMPPSSSAPWSGLTPSLAAPANASWLRLHWRPFVTVGAVTALLGTGVALRHLAPDRDIPTKAAAAQAQVPVCQPACWNGEACTAGQCVWQKPNNVGHVSTEPYLSGPFALPKDVADALPLDGERFAVALLTGTRIHSARTGEVLGHLSDTPQSRRLYRVGDTFYATSPQRIYVVDAATTRLLKTIEMGETVTNIAIGASGRRVIASMPGVHSVAVLATEFHAEIERIQFGDDPVGPVGIDDSGKRALITTGAVPLPGLRDPQGGAAYAFDPGRFASAQDRVRTSLLGNPVSVLMTPDGAMSYVALRAEGQIVPLEWQPSGAVRRKDAIKTCREPEQIVLLRRGRRALVRCNEGRALEVIDLAAGKVIEHIPLNARAADMAVSPDGEQAIVALPDEANSSIALVDLQTYDVAMLPVASEPTRVRLSPDGSVALVLSERAKVAWVLR
jgi:DNA-binding beta-propeller fold protein YncE